MNVSAISPSFNGIQTVKKENTRTVSPTFSIKSAQNKDSVSFKWAELLLHDCATRKELFNIIIDRLPAYLSNHYSKCLDMYYSLTAAMDSFKDVAKVLPDNLRFVFGFKRFNFLGKFFIYYTGGFKRNTLKPENVEDLLQAISKNKDLFETNERFYIAKGILEDSLKPEMREYLQRGERMLINNVLEDGDGRSLVLHYFSPYGRYLPEKEWMRSFANPKKDRDQELALIYLKALEEKNLLPKYNDEITELSWQIPNMP